MKLDEAITQCTDEIKGLCERAKMNIKRRVPLVDENETLRKKVSQQAAEIEQKDKRIAELGKELKQAKDMMDKWCDFAMLTEHAQDKYHPTLRDETMHFLYPKQALSNTGEK